MANLLKIDGYKPEVLLNIMAKNLKVRSDASLARYLGVGAPMICRIRQKKMAINGNILVRMHDASGVSLDELRRIAGIPKTKLFPPEPEDVVEEEAGGV